MPIIWDRRCHFWKDGDHGIVTLQPVGAGAVGADPQLLRDSSGPPGKRQALLDNGSGKSDNFRYVTHNIMPCISTRSDREPNDQRQRISIAGANAYQCSPSAGVAKTPPSQEDNSIDDSNSKVTSTLPPPCLSCLSSRPEPSPTPLVFPLHVCTDARFVTATAKRQCPRHWRDHQCPPKREQGTASRTTTAPVVKPLVPPNIRGGRGTTNRFESDTCPASKPYVPHRLGPPTPGGPGITTVRHRGLPRSNGKTLDPLGHAGRHRPRTAQIRLISRGD